MKSIFTRLNSFGLSSAPCRVVSSDLPAGGLGIQALPLQSKDDITSKYFVVGEFVGECNKFPTPYSSDRVFDRDAALLFNDYSVREGNSGLGLAGMCNNSLVFPNSFKVCIFDPAENKERFFLVTSGRVVNSGQELLWLDPNHQCRDSDFIPPWSVMNVQDNISNTDMDNVVFFLQQQHLSAPLDRESLADFRELGTKIPMDNKIINKVHQSVSAQSHGFMTFLLAQNFLVYQYCMRSELLKDRQALINAYREIGLRSIMCQPYLQSTLVRMHSSTPGLSRSLIPVDFQSHLVREEEIFSLILKDDEMKAALQGQNWQLFLMHDMWMGSLSMPNGFDYMNKRDRVLMTKLDSVYRYCYRFLSFKGDTSHYLKAMTFMQSLSFMIPELHLAAGGRYPLEMFSPKLLEVIRCLKKVINFGLQANGSQQILLLMTQLKPNISNLSRQLMSKNHEKFLEFTLLFRDKNPVALYNFMIDLFIERLEGEIDSMGISPISQRTNGSLTSVSSESLTMHSGVDAFYDELTHRLDPYTQRFMDKQCLSDLNNWRSPEKMLFMKTLFESSPSKCLPSKPEAPLSACQDTMFLDLAPVGVIDATSCGLEIGDTVTLVALKNEKYNGKEGIICGYSNDRVVVCMGEDQSKKTIRPINLVLKQRKVQSADLSDEVFSFSKESH